MVDTMETMGERARRYSCFMVYAPLYCDLYLYGEVFIMNIYKIDFSMTRIKPIREKNTRGIRVDEKKWVKSN